MISGWLQRRGREEGPWAVWWAAVPSVGDSIKLGYARGKVVAIEWRESSVVASQPALAPVVIVESVEPGGGPGQ